MSIVSGSEKSTSIEAEVQCLPLYSVLLAMDNPTVNYFR